jgi:glycerol-3-phosphate O-acyltransferase
MVFFKEVFKNIKSPFQFQSFHQAVRSPFDYYKWGNEFLRPLIIKEKSRVFGEQNIRRIEELTSSTNNNNKDHNIILFSNHQTEADPQVISLLLEEIGLSSLAERIVFLAGHKVTSDPVAVPFSMGRNLICIHSKKHIKNPPEEFQTKTAQNLDSMRVRERKRTCSFDDLID